MKMRTVKVLLCATLMALTLSMTACGDSDSGSESAVVEEEVSAEEEAPEEEEAPAEEKAPEEEEAPAEEEAPEEEEAPAEGEASAEASDVKTLEEYMKEDPAAEQQLKEQAAAQGNEQMDMDIEVIGNDVFCIATFKDSVEIPENAADVLQEGMDEVGTVFSAIAGVLDDAIGAEKGTVSYGIRYCSPDGSVIVERSFRAE